MVNLLFLVTRILFLVLLSFYFSGDAPARDNQNLTINNPQKMYFVKLKAADKKVRSELANFIPIDQIIEDNIYSVVNENDYKLLQKNYLHLLIESHLYQEQITSEADNDFPGNDTPYHTYQEVNDELQSFHTLYPDQTELFSIGKSVENRPITGIKIFPKKESDLSNRDTFTPGLLIVGLHHAREHLTTEIAMKYIAYLLETTNPEIKNLLSKREVYIIPILNPDGAIFDISNKSYHYWRKNRQINKGSTTYGVDLNRNYGYQWGTGGSSTSPSSDVFMGPKPFSEPETVALKNFMISKPNVRILLSLHTYSELVLYPWGYTDDSIIGKDKDVFVKMAETMAAWNKYTPMQSSELYIASGDTCDYAYGEHGIFCFTFELSPKSEWQGGGFYPGVSAIQSTYQANILPLNYLLEYSDSPYRVLEK